MPSQPLSLSNILWSRPAHGTQSPLSSSLPLSPMWPSQVLAVQARGRGGLWSRRVWGLLAAGPLPVIRHLLSGWEGLGGEPRSEGGVFARKVGGQKAESAVVLHLK